MRISNAKMHWKTKTKMRKTNAKIEGKKYSKNKITSKKNNLNDYAPLRIP